jgi:hypothetical protein
MQRKQLRVEQALLSKGFQQGETHHHYFVYWTIEGRKTTSRTFTSHGTRDLDSYLLGKMAKQCQLTKPQFDELIDCPMSRAQYEAILRQKGVA